jgi:hypothetical protein
MIISIIIIYLLGVFLAYLITAWENDKMGNHFKSNVFVILWSWILVFTYIIGHCLEFLSNYKPSLKAFLILFQRKDYKNR